MENKSEWTYRDYPLDQIHFKRNNKDVEPEIDEKESEELKQLID